MNRTHFLRSSATVLALSLVPGAKLFAGSHESKKIIRPSALRSGDTVGLIAPASPLDEKGLQAVQEKISSKLGVKTKIGKSLSTAYKSIRATMDADAQTLALTEAAVV